MCMPHSNSVTLVQAWQDAANTQNVDRLIALSDPNIEIVGPRGSGYGHQLLREWLGRAGLRLEMLRVFARGDAVSWSNTVSGIRSRPERWWASVTLRRDFVSMGSGSYNLLATTA